MDNRHILTVSELNNAIRSLLEGRFPFISVSGEISNLHRPYSGHYYFTLKDQRSQIKAVLFKPQQRYLVAQPKDGLHVVCRGRISVYEPRGEYQLIVDTIDHQGVGGLQQAFEQLKNKLAAEGLFDEHLKRSLPAIPRHITLITSPEGAAVHDFIRVATRRYPPIQISIYPVAVQGDQAAGDIMQAIVDVNTRMATDLIVLCRGGGSTEDLWAFNNEKLARAIRSSALPVVSAVGHEIDFTIADFAADLRAPTPSAAAELLVPDWTALQRGINACRVRIERALHGLIEQYRQRLLLAQHQLETMPHPLDRMRFRLDQLHMRIELSMRMIIVEKQRRLNQLALGLEQRNPAHRLTLSVHKLAHLQKRLGQAMALLLKNKEYHLKRAAGVLNAVSPLATLARGYAIVRTAGSRKKIVTASSQVACGDSLHVTLHKGEIICRVETTMREQHPRPDTGDES